MDDSLIKPDVMLVTKNVMVPLALPASKNKLFPNPFSSKKKTKIVKTKKYKTMPKTEDIDYVCRHRKDKSNEKKLCSTNYLDSNYNSSINSGEKENYEYFYSRAFTINDTTLKEETKSKRQSFLSESFPKHSMTIEKEEESRKTSLPRSSRSVMSSPKNDIVKIKKSEELVLQKFDENEVEWPCDENEEHEILSYKIRRRSRKISLPKSSRSLASNEKDDKIEDKKTEELSLEKSNENLTQCLQDEFEIITNKINREPSANSIIELNRCISDDISSKLCVAVDKEESKSITDNKCEIKYSWQDLDNWVPPSRKKKIGENLEKSRAGDSDCKIKYSWQVIGTCAQTSYHLMENFLSNNQILQNNQIGAKNYPCSVKYSWQIIGTGTQVTFSNSNRYLLENDKEYWEGKLLTPCKRSLEYSGLKDGIWKAGNSKILYSEGSQTFAEKSHQTDMTDCRAKYSWQNLTKSYLATNKLP